MFDRARPATPLILLALFTALAALVTVAPRGARACSCAWLETDALFPADGQQDVPTNTRIWVGGGMYWAEPGDAEYRLTLLDGDGATVEVLYSDLTGYNDLISVMTPTSALQAGETYEIWVDGDEVLGRFTVGSDSDTSPPTVPAEMDRESSASARVAGMQSSCGPSDVVNLTLENTGLVYVANIEGVEGPDTATLDGESSDLSPAPEFRIGSAGCTWSWPDAAPGASTTVRWGVFDLAGNFSGWSEPVSVSVPPAGCNCVLGGAPRATGGIAAAGLALLVLVRRRQP
jgi:MYXO-CTERM domain-containing protein